MEANLNERIAQALNKLLDRHRIVFWYDSKQELRQDFETLYLDGVEKIELQNNEFGVKRRILREAPQQKFLLYKEGPQPDDLDNWLLDVQLAQGEFRADQVGLWLSELGLGVEFIDVVQDHVEFYKSAQRKDALKRLLKPDDTLSDFRLKMLAVCAGADPRLDSLLEHLLAELAEAKEDKIRLIARCALDDFLWRQMEREYGYRSETPGIRDWVIELFKSCYRMTTGGEVKLTGDALAFLKRWKDSRQFERAFETLSQECAQALDIEGDLSRRDFRETLELDLFRLIDPKIISDLVRALADRTVAWGDVVLWARQRRQGHWYAEFRPLYEALDYGAQFIGAVEGVSLSLESPLEGIERYCQTWYRVDQLYRKFTFHVRQSGQLPLMASLTRLIDNLYTNNYLLPLGDRWQAQVDSLAKWNIFSIPLQNAFFQRWVQPFIEKDKKVCVIISDALRYEIGEELARLIRQEDRYEAQLDAALSLLPSYTQLGMAALLPHQELSLDQDGKGTVLVDGFSSQGAENRQKILDRALPKRGRAIKAEELLKLNREDSRALFRDHDIVYVYHNWIDKVGDNRDSEERVFEAAETTCQDLIKLVKKLTAANASNLLITADHGFIYQNQALEQSDFSACEPKGKEILYQGRRFVLGRGLQADSGLRKFSSAELGLAGDLEALIPKSINRLRLKGSGSRFVHGGASLQEVVIPVVRVNKKRQSDLSQVEVEILRGSSAVITTGQLTVVFYQAEPATDKTRPRALQAGVYTQEGELISDSHELTFDLTAENPRERERPVRFILTRKADQANNQEVILRLRERVGGTSHYQEYKSATFRLRSLIERDFDF